MIWMLKFILIGYEFFSYAGIMVNSVTGRLVLEDGVSCNATDSCLRYSWISMRSASALKVHSEFSRFATSAWALEKGGYVLPCRRHGRRRNISHSCYTTPDWKVVCGVLVGDGNKNVTKNILLMEEYFLSPYFTKYITTSCATGIVLQHCKRASACFGSSALCHINIAPKAHIAWYSPFLRQRYTFLWASKAPFYQQCFSATNA